MKTKKIFFVILIGILFLAFHSTPNYLLKPPSGYLSQGEEYLAEIFPAHSRLENSDSRCFFYKVTHLYSYDNYDAKKRYEIIWEGELINNTAPREAIPSRNGYLVTFDNYEAMGLDHSLTIYNKTGTLIGDFNLEELIPHSEINQFIYDFDNHRSLIDLKNQEGVKDSDNVLSEIEKISLLIGHGGLNINWRYNARYFYTNPNVKSDEESWWFPTHLYILLSYNKVIEIQLSDGSPKYDELVQFPHLLKLLSEDYIIDEAKVYEINLEYSSVTELLECLD